MSEQTTPAPGFWSGKPGVPLNPKEDGPHWLSWRDEKPRAVEWDSESLASIDEDKQGFWRFGDLFSTPEQVASDGWRYHGPVLSHDQSTALQARVVELEEILSGLLKTFEGVGFRIGQTHPPRTASYEEAEQHYATNYQGETALFMYQQWCQWKLACMARAVLGVFKDG